MLVIQNVFIIMVLIFDFFYQNLGLLYNLLRNPGVQISDPQLSIVRNWSLFRIPHFFLQLLYLTNKNI